MGSSKKQSAFVDNQFSLLWHTDKLIILQNLTYCLLILVATVLHYYTSKQTAAYLAILHVPSANSEQSHHTP